MDTTKERREWFGQSTGKAVEAMTLWADANQKILQETVTLTGSTATEGLRLYTELQASTVEAAKAGRDYWLRQVRELQEWRRDPLAWYQKTLLEGIEETRKAFGTAEQTAEKIQQTFTNLAAEVRGLYTPVQG